MIRQMHFVWVGDDSKRPDNLIETWRRHHPQWAIKVWGNDELHGRRWELQRHIDEWLAMDKPLCGIADMMRWEILWENGGLALDADAVCLRPLDDALFDCELFAVNEHERLLPGVVANGIVYSMPRHRLIRKIIDRIGAMPSLATFQAFQCTGPQAITQALKGEDMTGIRLLPSHYFLPEHHYEPGVYYDGPDPVYSRQLWGSTHEAYDTMHTLKVDE